MRSKARRARSSKRSTAVAIGALLLRRFRLRSARTDGYVVQANSQKPEQSESPEHGLEQPLPHCVAPGNHRILRQPAIAFRIGCVMQDVNDVRTTNRLWIVDAGLFKSE